MNCSLDQLAEFIRQNHSALWGAVNGMRLSETQKKGAYKVLAYLAASGGDLSAQLAWARASVSAMALLWERLVDEERHGALYLVANHSAGRRLVDAVRQPAAAATAASIDL